MAERPRTLASRRHWFLQVVVATSGSRHALRQSISSKRHSSSGCAEGTTGLPRRMECPATFRAAGVPLSDRGHHVPALTMTSGGRGVGSYVACSDKGSPVIGTESTQIPVTAKRGRFRLRKCFTVGPPLLSLSCLEASQSTTKVTKHSANSPYGLEESFQLTQHSGELHRHDLERHSVAVQETEQRVGLCLVPVVVNRRERYLPAS